MNAIFTQTLGTRSLVVLTVLSLLVSLMPVTASAVAHDVYGCTDQAANNHHPAANIDDGSCDYGPTEVDLEIIKAISGETLGFDLSDFSYQVTGGGVNETVPHGGTVTLPIGTYSIEELVPAGFVKEDWRIGWYGECERGDTFFTTITIDDGNVDHGTLRCTADNQYRPAEIYGCTDSHATNYNSLATADDGSCEYPDTPDYGCTDIEAVNYDPNALYDDGSCIYAAYGCTDSAAVNYDPSATIDDGSCEYEEPTYKVYGYVWHDQNENDVWDGEEGSEEPELSGWTVTITDGETTFSVVSDESGYYEFYVPAGTWTITQAVQSEWVQTFPNNGQHVVVVVDESVEVNDDSQSLTLFDLFIPTAHAQAAPAQTEYGPFDFGNNQTSGGGVGGDSGGSGGSRPPRCDAFDIAVAGDKATLTWETKRGSSMIIEADGVEIFSTSDDDVVDGDTLEVDYTDGVSYELTVSRGSRSDSCGAAVGSADGGGPTPLVLGDQVSAVPVGGAHAGAGGAAPTPVETPNTSFVAALFGAMRRRNG